jgi:hypothetical protein
MKGSAAQNDFTYETIKRCDITEDCKFSLINNKTAGVPWSRDYFRG